MPRRSIDTEMWSDARFSELSAHAKLVFIRLTTGPDTTPCGAVRLAPKRVAVDCEISRDQVNDAMDELVHHDLVRRYDDGWVWLPSWIKHQVSGPGFIKSVRRASNGLPDSLARAVGRELDRLFPRSKAVDNSPDGSRGSDTASTRSRQTTDKVPTENVAPSRDVMGETPCQTGGETGGQTGVPLREGSVPVTGTGTGPGLSFGQTDLVCGQEAVSNAPSSAAAGAAAGANDVDDEQIAEVVSLAIARAHSEPVPDPAREAERAEVAREIERRRQAKLMAEASA